MLIAFRYSKFREILKEFWEEALLQWSFGVEREIRPTVTQKAKFDSQNDR